MDRRLSYDRLVLPSPSSTAFEQSMSALVSNLRTKMDDPPAAPPTNDPTNANMKQQIQAQMLARGANPPEIHFQPASDTHSNSSSAVVSPSPSFADIPEHMRNVPIIKATNLTVHTGNRSAIAHAHQAHMQAASTGAAATAAAQNPIVAFLKSPKPPMAALISPTTAARTVFSFDGTLPSPSLPGGKSHFITVSGANQNALIENQMHQHYHQHHEQQFQQLQQQGHHLAAIPVVPNPGLTIATSRGSRIVGAPIQNSALLTPVSRLIQSLNNGKPDGVELSGATVPQPLFTPVTRMLNSLAAPAADMVDTTVDYVVGNFMDTINTLTESASSAPASSKVLSATTIEAQDALLAHQPFQPIITPQSSQLTTSTTATSSSAIDYNNLFAAPISAHTSSASAFSEYLASSIYDMDPGITSFDAFHDLLEKQNLEAQLYNQYNLYQQHHQKQQSMQVPHESIDMAQSDLRKTEPQFKQPHPFNPPSQQHSDHEDHARGQQRQSLQQAPPKLSTLLSKVARQGSEHLHRPAISSPLTLLVPPDSPLSATEVTSPTASFQIRSSPANPPAPYAASAPRHGNSSVVYPQSPLGLNPAYTFPSPPVHRKESSETVLEDRTRQQQQQQAPIMRSQDTGTWHPSQQQAHQHQAWTGRQGHVNSPNGFESSQRSSSGGVSVYKHSPDPPPYAYVSQQPYAPGYMSPQQHHQQHQQQQHPQQHQHQHQQQQQQQPQNNNQHPPSKPTSAQLQFTAPTSKTGGQANLLKCPIDGCKKFFKKQESLVGHMATAHGTPLPNQASGLHATLPSLQPAIPEQNVQQAAAALGPSKPGSVEESFLQAMNPPPDATAAATAAVATAAAGEIKLAYQCDQCEQTFSRSHDLKRHRYTHSAARPFACKRCGKGFARRDVLRKHEKAFEDGKKVTCIAGSGGGDGAAVARVRGGSGGGDYGDGDDVSSGSKAVNLKRKVSEDWYAGGRDGGGNEGAAGWAGNGDG
ncbi:hypothetical protein HDU80_011540, partial [Chytriomyces hyalinus]